MTFITPKQARKDHPCPFARTFHEKKGGNCDADKCIAWRWRPLAANDPRVLSAYTRVATEMMDDERKKTPDTKKTIASFHKASVAKVAAANEDFIFMTDDDRGFCGLAGKP